MRILGIYNASYFFNAYQRMIERYCKRIKLEPSAYISLIPLINQLVKVSILSTTTSLSPSCLNRPTLSIVAINVVNIVVLIVVVVLHQSVCIAMQQLGACREPLCTIYTATSAVVLVWGLPQPTLHIRHWRSYCTWRPHVFGDGKGTCQMYSKRRLI